MDRERRTGRGNVVAVTDGDYVSARIVEVVVVKEWTRLSPSER